MLPIKVPPLGESIVEATVSRWLKKEGDAVAAGDTVVELDTDKITVEVPALKPGVLAKQAKKEGDVVHVDDVLGEIDESAAPATAGATQSAPSAAAKPAVPASAPPASQAAPPLPASRAPLPASEPVKSSPAARRIAEQRDIDIAAVAGTGRGGVVSKPDVLAAASGISAPRPQTPAPSAPARGGNGAAPGERETREKMSTRRKRIAENLLQSQHATAHLTTFNEADMSALNSLREKYKEKIEKEHGVKLTFMPFFVRAVVQALKQFPTINAQVDGDAIIYKHYVNMGIAVASDQGLVVPNVKDADRKSLLEVSRDIAEVAKRARDGKLTMDDLTGGTFTITNGGVFGSLVSTPIINYPQVGILGLHKTQDRPVVINGQVVIRPMMYIALSYDHRIVEGQQAVQFLVRVKELIEDPAAMLIE
ncbi:MAG TPA: 2-oxoglutarate dehydrogenase complex dihydrolipoyllysine-residue succinyltransferase [Gemmatimonadaceae bacterium]|jgi:2-oxoglutarate dehydrogenase E2 component (dihydrolipoamide succinyltransferase)|nr:2-oxoglutarate dehydrogenase complex dihydrolipoyllysine-residue succinyltransferase [Gemmatimonadaceae bacterium]